MSLPCSRPPLCKIFLFHHLGSSSFSKPPPLPPLFFFCSIQNSHPPSFRGLTHFCRHLCFQGVVSFVVHIKQRSLVTLSYLFLRAAIGFDREDVVRAEVRATFVYVSRYHAFTQGRLFSCQYGSTQSLSAHHSRLSTWALYPSIIPLFHACRLFLVSTRSPYTNRVVCMYKYIGQ